MGIRQVIIMSLEKKMDLPISIPLVLNSPSFASLLNFSIPTSLALKSSATNNPSTITTAPSMIIPKSIAPIESRLAFIPFMRIQIKANNKDNGIIILTITVVRQSAINNITISVTSNMPSIKLCITVSCANSISVVRS